MSGLRYFIFISVAAALVCLLWPAGRVSSALVGAAQLPGSRIEGDRFPRILVDPAGRRQRLEHKPGRIVSMVLSSDEVLMDLVDPARIRGMTFLATDAVSSNCASRIPKGMPSVHEDLEPVLSLDPDLLIVAGYTDAGFTRTMVSAGVPLLHIAGYQSLADIRQNIELIARAVGEDDNGRELVRQMDARIEAVRYRVKGLARPRVLFLIEGDGTHGGQTTINEVIEAAGGNNIAASEAGIIGSRVLSLESAISLNPDVILLMRYTDNPEDPVRDRYLKDPNWQEVKAVRTGRVYSVPYRSIISMSHYLADGTEAVSKVLHPEAWQN